VPVGTLDSEYVADVKADVIAIKEPSVRVPATAAVAVRPIAEAGDRLADELLCARVKDSKVKTILAE
jgi:hypothetical protein